ncbi:uncharacterized protein CIMG_10135 [Coccidioides immitis RS]|uniref:Uncharacterized protein n=1 Tax=Coccidioides immitis (strain RS) TaxID=246410 RepID=J3K0W1_COCIM|nr:uncharacterized protein CIMG_10135 [Coccidioides immitis RS]EAS27530.3 hypothetical protein CIMG_10135 [Coccidioides immitis RS]
MKSYFAAASTLFALAFSQATVPPDLSGGFGSGSIDLQVSFGGDASDGLADGAVVSKQDASRTPNFALGDASGVNTALSFMIMMVDTTEEGSRRIHYMQTDFKATGEKTKIESSSEPAVKYTAPGSLGETGKREYSFLMYLQRGETSLGEIPAAGDEIDVKEFEQKNGLPEARAGLAISVDMGGEDGQNTETEVATTSTAATTSATMSSTSDPVATTSSSTSVPPPPQQQPPPAASPPPPPPPPELDDPNNPQEPNKPQQPDNDGDPVLFPFPFSFPMSTPAEGTGIFADPPLGTGASTIAPSMTVTTILPGPPPPPPAAANNATTLSRLPGRNAPIPTPTLTLTQPTDVETEAELDPTGAPDAAETPAQEEPEIPVETQTSVVFVRPGGSTTSVEDADANANAAGPEETLQSQQDSGSRKMGVTGHLPLVFTLGGAVVGVFMAL